MIRGHQHSIAWAHLELLGESLGGEAVAKNGPKDKARIGAVKGRSQVVDPRTGQWAKRDTSTGRFTQVKKSGGSFKGVRRED